MQIKSLFKDDSAVSPVIGVILMVAITVILAAVIATFVLGLGDQVGNTAPQSTFSFDYDSGTGDLDITHEGGDSIEPAELYVRGDASYNWDTDGGHSEMVSAGTTVTVDVEDSDSVSVVWDSGNGDSATLGNWDGPNA